MDETDRRMVQVVIVLFVILIAAQIGRATHPAPERPYLNFPLVNISRTADDNVTFTWYSGVEQTFIREVRFTIDGATVGTWRYPSVYAGTRTFSYDAPPDVNASVVLAFDDAGLFLMAQKRV